MISINSVFALKRPIFHKTTITRPTFKSKKPDTIDSFEKQIAGTGYVKKRIGIRKRSQPVKLVKTKSEELGFDTYNFDMFDGKDIIGSFKFSEFKNIPTPHKKIDKMFKDYPRHGIVGDRIYVSAVNNLRKGDYSGIGECADQVIIEHCLRTNYPTNIVMKAAFNAHAAHYKRGYRFIDSKKNEEIQRIIDTTPKGSECQTGHLGISPAYLPKEQVRIIKQKIKNRPFLN